MAAQPLAVQVGVAPACQALGVSRATFYRRQRSTPGHQQPRPTPARALCESEREHVLDVLACPRFVDRAPAEVVATLLDEGQYLCSARTMYRILAANQPVRERRNQRDHPQYTKPELVATGPNQTWSWDITKLLGPKKWTYFYLYVVLDIFSRYAVGWMVADRENSALAGRLIEQTCHKQGVQPQVLTLHSDRGAPMTSKCTAYLAAVIAVLDREAKSGFERALEAAEALRIADNIPLANDVHQPAMVRVIQERLAALDAKRATLDLNDANALAQLEAEHAFLTGALRRVEEGYDPGPRLREMVLIAQDRVIEMVLIEHDRVIWRGGDASELANIEAAYRNVLEVLDDYPVSIVGMPSIDDVRPSGVGTSTGYPGEELTGHSDLSRYSSSLSGSSDDE